MRASSLISILSFLKNKKYFLGTLTSNYSLVNLVKYLTFLKFNKKNLNRQYLLHQISKIYLLFLIKSLI
jgi:hypothetical protein